MKWIGKLMNWAFFLGMVGTAYILMLKSLWLNDVHATLRQDPLDIWIAIGVSYLMFNEFRKQSL